MTLSPILLRRLAAKIDESLGAAEVGHCMRVDHLSPDDAASVVAEVSRRRMAGSSMVRLLTELAGDPDVSLTPPQAIEVRNRKRVRLCLVVPAGFSDTTVSSLGSAFAFFGLEAFFEEEAASMLEELDEETRGIALRVRDTLRGAMRASPEHWADYLAATMTDPDPRSMGIGLWRVGLIPDAGPEFWQRLPDNRACVLKVAKTKRPYASAEERLTEIGFVDGRVRSELSGFLRQQRLQDSRVWLRRLSDESYRGAITFERWELETDSSGDLASIDVAPLLKANGDVDRTTGLKQEAPGSQPYAAVGDSRSVRIKWQSTPKHVESVARWRAELIPSRQEHLGDNANLVDLPQAHAGAKVRSLRVPLDIDLDETSVRAVQVRVVGLTNHGAEISIDGVPVEGLSEEFWLREDGISVDDDGEERGRRETVSTLPLGRLTVALASKTGEIQEAPPQWVEDELHYFSITMNRRSTIRVGLSPVLRQLEERRFFEAEGDGRFSAALDSAETLAPTAMLEVLESEEIAGSDVGRKLAKYRKELFALLDRQEHRRYIETAVWDRDIARRVRSYAAAYRDALSQTGGRALEELLSIDTIHLTLRHPRGDEEALLTLPTHPLRLLWYSAYAELLASWEAEVLAWDGDRQRLLDLNLLGRVAPLNFPPCSVSSGKTFLFAQNLRFFWGLSLPADVVDPARRAADVARVVGLREDEASLTDLPPARLAAELESYRHVHPYLDVLRLSLLNPGSGAFVARALEASRFAEAIEDESGEVVSEPPRLEVVAHAHDPLPVSIPGLQDLQRRLYETPPRIGGTLSPFFSLTLRKMGERDRLPGGEVNLSIIMDSLRPHVGVAPVITGEDSASFYGLLLRMVPQFQWDGATARWDHVVALPEAQQRERHPVTPTYTNELVEGVRDYLAGLGLVLEPDGSGSPAVTASLSPEERGAIDRLHHDSDWVITLDRFLGVDYFDDASNPDLSRVSRRYLLDYAPEFLEGLGHRMFVTTSQRDEVETLLSRAMTDLGFGLVEESVGDVLAHLKTISGRIALRTIGDDARAREAVSLGVVAAYLDAQGELVDTILVPVDAHPELFGVAARADYLGTPRSRCDLIQVRLTKRKVHVRFIETKSRSAVGTSDELLNRIVDQIVATEQVVRDLFFRADPPRLDHVLQRSRLATILRFYLRRADRHGLISSADALGEMEDTIGRLESGLPDMQVERRGYIVNLPAEPEPPIRLRDAEIRILTKDDLLIAGFVPSEVSLPRPETTAEDAPIAVDAGNTTDVRAAGVGAPEPPQPRRAEPVRLDEGPPLAVAPAVQEAEAASSLVPVGGEPAPGPPPGGPGRGEGTVADLAAEEIQVLLGATELDQEAVIWRPKVRGSPHMFVLGIPGQGKSWTVTRILNDLHRQELPSLVFDFHGQFADPAGPYAEAASPTVLDASEGLPFSPFEADLEKGQGASYWMTNAFAMAEIFQYVCGLGVIQQDLVYRAIRGCYEEAGFEDAGPQRLPTVGELAQRLADMENSAGVRNVLPRCRPLLEFGLFPDHLDSSVTFADVLRRSSVLDVSRVGLEAVQLGAAAFVLRKVYKDMFQWGETDRLRLVLVLDEAHRLTKDITLPKIMKEGRKFGVAVVVASQGLADFHQDVLGNAGTKVIYRTNFPMSKKVAGFLRPDRGVDLASMIEQLDVGEAYVQTPEMSRCARTRMKRLS